MAYPSDFIFTEVCPLEALPRLHKAEVCATSWNTDTQLASRPPLFPHRASAHRKSRSDKSTENLFKAMFTGRKKDAEKYMHFPWVIYKLSTMWVRTIFHVCCRRIFYFDEFSWQKTQEYFVQKSPQILHTKKCQAFFFGRYILKKTNKKNKNNTWCTQCYIFPLRKMGHLLGCPSAEYMHYVLKKKKKSVNMAWMC